MREFGWSEEKVLKGGYYKAHRYWLILNEVRAGEQHNQSVISLMPYMTDKGRNEIFDALKRQQPRRHKDSTDKLPPEIEAKLRSGWSEMEARRRIKREVDARSKPKTSN